MVNMKKNYVIKALKRERSVISGELLIVKKQKDELAYKLEAVDTCLVFFGYKGDPTRIAPTNLRNRYFNHRELLRMVRTIMKERSPLIINKELAEEIIKLKGWNMEDKTLSPRVARPAFYAPLK